MNAFEQIATSHLEPGETLRGAVPAFTDGGFGRRILAVTDRRVLLIRSGYMRFSDRGVDWSDDARGVRLVGDVVQTNVRVGGGAAKSGNSYVTINRGDKEACKLNIRQGFLFRPQSDKHLTTLFSLLPQ